MDNLNQTDEDRADEAWAMAEEEGTASAWRKAATLQVDAELREDCLVTAEMLEVV